MTKAELKETCFKILVLAVVYVLLIEEAITVTVSFIEIVEAAAVATIVAVAEVVSNR